MRRKIAYISIIIALLLQSCQILAMPVSTPTASLPSTPTKEATTTPVPTAASTATLAPTATQTATPIPTYTPTPTLNPTLTPSQVPTNTYTVWYHPSDGLYVGDQVSMEVIAPRGQNMDGKQARIQVDGSQGASLGPVGFGGFGNGNRIEALFTWSWDTRGLQAGEHILTYTIQPSGPTWTETVTLQPQSALPPPEPQAHWASARSSCCVLNYITGTEAERDLTQIMSIVDAQAQDVENKLGAKFSQPVNITFLPRVLGQGGFAGDEIDVSYLDRNYVGKHFEIIVHHEMVHIIDGQLGGKLRPTLLVEGLAVYMTGGHYKHEPLSPRAAALLEMPPASPGSQGWYIPLRTLADNFYPAQHEIGYLEGASLIEYMVKTWGWQSFNTFYRDIQPDPSGSQAKAIETALQKHFNLTFDDLEKGYLNFLRSLQVTQQMKEDVRLTVTYYDTMRRYQQMMDPTAFFQNPWLINNKEIRKRGIVADYLRHPQTPENIALETLMVQANDDLTSMKYTQAEALLQAANAVLDAYARQQELPFNTSPVASDYYAIVKTVEAAGYQPQNIQLNNDSAQVTAIHFGSVQPANLLVQRQGKI